MNLVISRPLVVRVVGCIVVTTVLAPMVIVDRVQAYEVQPNSEIAPVANGDGQASWTELVQTKPKPRGKGKAPTPDARSAPPDDATPSGEFVALLGLRLVVLNKANRDALGVAPGIVGLYISEIDPNSGAAATNLQIGEVILEVNQTPVGSVGDVIDLVRQEIANGRDSNLLMVQNRNGERRFVVVRVAAG